MKKAKVSKYGQWKYPGQDTIIPNANGSITMKGVPYPVLGIDDQGNQQMMMPGNDYQFPGNSVYEIPMAKKGGAKKVKIKSLPKAQVGMEMPFGLPLKEQNIYTLPEYNQPRNPKTGEILPDPRRPNLGMGTGATEYKMTYGVDEGDVDVPSIVGGQYIGNQAYDRYNLTGERFKTMTDPGSYSNFYEQIGRLGLMQEKQGGAIKQVKIKSLPKAQSGPSSSGLTSDQQQNFEDQYFVYRDQGDSSNDARRLAFNDASYFGSGPIYNLQSFLPNPDSGVRVASGKRFPYENIDPKTFDPWEENYMSDPEHVARYNKMTPDQQRMAQDNVYRYEGLDTYNYNLDNVKKWEKNWYSKRATLPQFTDVANKRLSLIENINMQPYGNVAEYQNMMPGSGGVFMPSSNNITIPSTSFSYPSVLAHERSHWYDWNAPQNDDMYNGSYLRSSTKGPIPNPVYNDEDLILNSIIPGNYKMPYGSSEPLRLGENDTNTYDSESEKIINNLPNASDNIKSSTVKIPFKGQEMMFGNTRNNVEYYSNPTEVRARLNEWRMQNSIDPTKDYSNEELQQIIDDDIKNNRSLNFDLYKVIQGRGDLLKQINDSYVSTGDKENVDEMPKAQTMGAFSDWRNMLDYKNAAEPKKNLVGDIRKVKAEPIVSESTLPNKTVKTPDSWKGRTTKDIKAEADAQIAYDALPEELKRRDTLTADTRSDAEKFARRAWTAVSQPMETIAALNKGYDIPSGYLGMGDAYEGYNVGSPMTSVVDMGAGLPAFIGNAAYRQGEKIVNNPLEYLAVNTLGLFDSKTRGEALGNYFDLSAVLPAASLASPLIRSAARSTSKVTKPSLLTQASRNNPSKYEDDLFRYLADSETSSGVDRNYLMSLSDDVYGRQQVIGADLRDPGYRVDQDLLRGWLAEDARINNRVMPPPTEITFDGVSFTDNYSNPFDVNNIIDLTRAGSSSSLRDRLVGRMSDTYRRFARATADDVPISQVRDQFRNFRGSTPAGQPVPTNRSYLTKEETKALVKDKTELDKLNKLNDTEFRDILITPDGKIKLPEKYKGPKQIATMEVEEYVNDFNDNLDLLNDIIRRNNTSGRDYTVTGLTKDGQLKFRTDDGRTSYMSTGITPGRFRGDIQDVASMDYMANAIPGLRMEGASPIFGDAVRGTGTYKSLNEYLKTLDLGRIKSGMNSQSPYSRPLWENAIKKGDAFGYYGSPRTVYGIMKKEGGTKKKKPGFQVLTDANGKYVFVKT